ncbi:methylmalonyl-CoA mutase subunit beta [Flavobacteriaceae bacterium]|nr:methylmalonyl-CoA mutase subunit beta [Flavobacteriaceae bacterium]
MKFDEFDSQSSKAWKQRIQYELDGADFNTNLVWNSLEGIDVKPFYHADSSEQTLPIPHQSDEWKIGEYIYVQNVKSANKKALECLSKGTESIYFILPKASICIDELLNGIVDSAVRIYLELNFSAADFLTEIDTKIFKSHSTIFLISDSIGHLCKSGNWYKNKFKDFSDTLGLCSATEGVKSVFSVDIAQYQNAGAAIVQQLAYGLAHAHEYLLEFKNVMPEEVVFKVAVGGNYFFEIAKLQALRWLWNSLIKDYDLSTRCHIIAEPSKRNKTIYEYNVNMLRTMTEIMSAALGSSDTIINLPYDVLYHKDNEFGRRISRNQLLILKHESKFSTVTNPTMGAYYIEDLTNQFAEKALALFKDIEKQGGFLKQLIDGTIQKKIKEYAKKEQDSFDNNNQELVGIHIQQNTNEKIKEQLELYPFVKHQPRKTLIEPIIGKRIAESIEKKRLGNE